MANTLFVNFDVRNRFNVSSLSGMALSGYAFSFIPVLRSDVTTISQNKVLWDFGDGTTSSQVSANHTYLFPGQYNIILYVYGIGGTAYVNSFVPSVSVYDYVPNTLDIGDLSTVTFDQFAGHYRPFTIVRYNSWQTYQSLSAEGYTIGLYVSGAVDPSQNLEQYREDEWGHLRTLTRFAQKVPAGASVEYQATTTVTTDDSLLYIKYNSTGIEQCAASTAGSVFAGTSGIATVYFSADTPKNTTSVQKPAIIFCSLNTHKLDDQFTYLSRYYDYASPTYGNINTQPAVLASVKTRNNVAQSISFSTNGIDSEQDAILSSFQMPVISWQNTHIPFVAKLEDGDGFSTRFYPLLSSNIQNLSTNSTTYDLSLAVLVSGAAGYTVMSSVSFYADFISALPSDVGGYLKGYFISPVSALNVKLSGSVVVSVLSGFELDSSTSFYSLTSGICRQDTLELLSSDISSLIYTLSSRNTAIATNSATRLTISPSNSAGYKNVVIYAVTSPTAISVKDIRGTSIATISVSANSLAADGSNNLWVTTRGAASALKYTTYGNLSAIALFTTVSAYSAGDIDTDTQNRAWVAYSKAGSSSYVVKYDTNGAYLTSYSLTSAFSVDKILIDRNDRVYFTVLSSTGPLALTARNDSIYCITSAGSLVAGYPLTGYNFAAPSNIALDVFNRLWTVTGQNSAKNTATGAMYKIGSTPASINSCALNYLVGDTYQNVSVYHNLDKSLAKIDVTTGVIVSAAISDIAVNATNDLNGFRWIDKYASTQTSTQRVTGESNLFNVYPSSGMYSIVKQGEDFDMSGYLKGLRLPDALTYTSEFFDKLLGTMVGGVTSLPYELGKTIHERIANFSSNHSDPDTATTAALVSLCEQYGVPLQGVVYNYPAQLRRIVDLLSIKHRKLFGTRNQYSTDFYRSGVTNAPGYAINIGTQVSITTDTFAVSDYVVVNELFSNTFKLARTATVSGYVLTDVLPFSAYSYNWGWDLVAPNTISGTDIGNYYKIFRYTPQRPTDIYDSTIDWTARGTTLSFNNSAYGEWVNEGGIIENMLTYEMTKGLRLFLSAADIVYNN